MLTYNIVVIYYNIVSPEVIVGAAAVRHLRAEVFVAHVRNAHLLLLTCNIVVTYVRTSRPRHSDAKPAGCQR